MDIDDFVIEWSSPRVWYSNVQFESDLLRSYAKSVEGQIQESIDKYHREKVVEIDETDSEYGPNIKEHHQGVDGSTYHLDTIFEDYFPNLQRRSALITQFSFLEYQIDELCRLFANENNFSLSLKDLNGKGIDRSYCYLTKVVGLKIENDTSTWNKLKRIQGLRNEIVHNDGKLKDAKIKSYVNTSPYLSGEDEVKIKEGYLNYVLDTFDIYFKAIDNQIPKKKRT
ncbi:MAG: hypothetical protein JNM09_14260 [Blastocatellia bacterium]|nr:hypothetical protein [Blastocatellia bacterium]